MKRIAFIFCLLIASGLVSEAAGTNYFCIVCGRGPLSGRIWLHHRGSICDDCEKIKDRCSICGLPVRPDDGHIKTGDGRIICKFDKADVVLTVDQARDLFQRTREEVVDLYGRDFALKTSDVTVNLFDVDYWSEKGRSDGLHKFGFSHTRYDGNGGCTHEVILLSGRTREEMIAVAAHEYTHLWINENRPASHHIDGETVEAICELTAYKLMQQKRDTETQKGILENPYTNGKINDLVAAEREGGTDYILNWVKTGTASTIDGDANLAPLPAPSARAPFIAGPRPLPGGLKFSGVMAFGKERLAVVNGVEFAAGDQKTVKLRDHSVQLRCVEIHDDEVRVEADGKPLTLSQGAERMVP